MALVEEFQQQGGWLFRWRSFLPLTLLALVPEAMRHLQFPFGSYYLHEVWEEVCLGISFLGLLVRVLTVSFAPARTSGRNTRTQIADTLNTTGLYSVVRHPLYLGNFLIGLGIALVFWEWWLPAIYTLAFCLYYERIMFAEEAFLAHKFSAEFAPWAATTPAFWPRISHWRRPDLPFSLRTVLRREYTCLAVVIFGHTGNEFVEHVINDHHMVWEHFWIMLAVGGTITYVVLRALKKHTRLLEVPGR